MKFIKPLLVIMAAAAITLALGGNGLAFHAEGVAECAGCHTMHNSQDGQAATDTPGGYLLLEGSATSTCLACHADYGQFAGGNGYGGGGDYYWITKDWTWEAHGHTSTSTGDSHGHNVIAPELGLNQDKVLSKAPGGNFSSANLSCASCHDPHGKGESEYLLRNNANYFGAVFPAAPVMKGLSRRTATIGSGGSASDTNHTAYGSGMSAWCAACHTTFDDGLAAHMHPTNQTLGSEIANNYNQYISTEDPTGGMKTGAYWEFVPFETGQAEASLDTTSTEGPDAGSKVACISCHRAHATAFPDAVRWDLETELLAESHPDGKSDTSTPEDKLNSYYGVPVETRWGPEQRSLCNKCHAQDGVHGP